MSDGGEPIAAGDGVALRLIRADDVATVDAWSASPELEGEFNDFGIERRSLRAAVQQGRTVGDGGGTLLVVASDGAAIGTVSWHGVHYGPNPESRAWNIGISLVPEARGRGLGVEAQRLLAAHLFASTTVNRVEASTDVENLPEQRALAKAGFVREGVARGAQWRAGGWHDLVTFALTRGDHALPAAVRAALQRHPAIREVREVGSRSTGRATPLSDWDFAVQTDEFSRLAAALPDLVSPLSPIAQQWDRLGSRRTYMLLLRGPRKVDLIFDEPQDEAPPWEIGPDTITPMDLHFWDWVLWLRAKELRPAAALVDDELRKLHAHLLRPLGVTRAPASVADAVQRYRAARDAAEARYAIRVPRDAESEVAAAILG